MIYLFIILGRLKCHGDSGSVYLQSDPSIDWLLTILQFLPRSFRHEMTGIPNIPRKLPASVILKHNREISFLWNYVHYIHKQRGVYSTISTCWINIL